MHSTVGKFRSRRGGGAIVGRRSVQIPVDGCRVVGQYDARSLILFFLVRSFSHRRGFEVCHGEMITLGSNLEMLIHPQY